MRAIDLDTDKCDRRKLWKELQQMVNKVSEDVKTLYESHNAVLEKVKALPESNNAVNEEFSRLQEGLENITEEKLQSLDSMKLEEQIKFQEFTAVVANRDVDFCVKVDDDIHVHVALEVQSKEPTKKVMMIFQEPILDAPMEASIQESMIQELVIQVSVIQESKMQAPIILMVLESNEVLRIQEHSKVQRTNETLKIEEPLKVQEFKQSFKIYKEETSMCIGLLVKEKCMNMVIKMSLRYWSIGRSPLMKMLFHNNTLWARCFQGEGNVRNAISIWIIIVVDLFSYNSKHVNHI